MNDLEKFFAATEKIVDESLHRLIPPADAAVPQRLYEAVRWSIFAGGKRFRPALLLAVGKTFGADERKLLPTAAAVEMIHTYSLIHDDLPAMDDDDLRRGRATCHVKFDEATAILAGDVLQSLAFGAVAGDENLPDRTKLRLVSELSRAAAKMVDGQQLDLDGEGRSVSLAELENIHRSKTGAMISFSARAGAIIADTDDAALAAITDYAIALGLLFQITDDLLDVTQTTETLGKTAGKDSRAEKATYPGFYGIEETARLAEKVYRQALDALGALDHDTALLKNLAEFILKREK